MKNIFLILSIVVSTYSCNNNKDNQAFPQNKEFDIIYNGALHGSGKEGIKQSNMVINNTTDWQNLRPLQRNPVKKSNKF